MDTFGVKRASRQNFRPSTHYSSALTKVIVNSHIYTKILCKIVIPGMIFKLWCFNIEVFGAISNELWQFKTSRFHNLSLSIGVHKNSQNLTLV